MDKKTKALQKDSAKKKLVLEILALFNGESYSFTKEVLELALYFSREHSYVDYDLANSVINEE